MEACCAGFNRPHFLAINIRKPPFNNVRVRQAVAVAINRADIRDVAYLGTGELGLEEMPTGSTWYDPSGVFAANPDIARAKQLLAEAGYPNGLSVEAIRKAEQLWSPGRWRRRTPTADQGQRTAADPPAA